VDAWADAVGQINNAWLPFFALGVPGEAARIGVIGRL
jgi:hypothetical protein